TFNLLWIKTQSELEQLLNEEYRLYNSKPERDREQAFKVVSTIYLKYVKIFRALEECFDQIVQPQKRLLLRQLLNGVIGRILELKHELVHLDNLEISYHDEAMMELSMSPNDAELIIPQFIVRDRQQEIAYWDDQMKQACEKMEQHDFGPKEPVITPEDAIALLQKHERARQGRLRAKLMGEIRKQEANEKAKNRAEEFLTSALAASKIQSIWKGALARRKVRKLREDELAFIGMIPPKHVSTKFQTRLKQWRATRRDIQQQYQQDFENALVSTKDKVWREEALDIEENMKDDIRKWFFNGRDDQGRFPDYPSDDEGGSAAVFHPERFQALHAENETLEGHGLGGMKMKKSDSGEGKSRGDQPSKSSTSDKKAKELDDEVDGVGAGFVLRESEFVRQLRKNHRNFQDIWKDKDESKNVAQTFDEEMIKEEKRREVEDEIRINVDSNMREELDRLKIAAERDKGRKGKIAKKRKKGKKKQGKKGKKKKEKDLTPDRSTESLFEELVLNGIIKPYPIVHLKEFLGNTNMIGSTLKKIKDNLKSSIPTPGGGDIRRLIIEYCILPMSSSNLRENSPHVKSLLLAGPEGTGKSMLVHAICTELKATFFDLTATNIVGKYPGKSGLNMLLHLVIKMSRLLQPSIIFMDQAEKTFLKKVTKTDKSDPKRLKKDLPRLVRSLSAEDRVMLIGISKTPWECEQKGLLQTYQKILLLPRPDYPQRHELWREIIISKGGDIESQWERFDLSALAKISDGYTTGQIVESASQVLVPRRLLHQGVRPLQPSEFIPILAKMDPMYREEEAAYETWFAKTPLGKKWVKQMEGDEDLKKDKKKAPKKKK
ncbi:hypothetical protein TCAL_00505, partial [Tigriopus californicus]